MNPIVMRSGWRFGLPAQADSLKCVQKGLGGAALKAGDTNASGWLSVFGYCIQAPLALGSHDMEAASADFGRRLNGGGFKYDTN